MSPLYYPCPTFSVMLAILGCRLSSSILSFLCPELCSWRLTPEDCITWALFSPASLESWQWEAQAGGGGQRRKLHLGGIPSPCPRGYSSNQTLFIPGCYFLFFSSHIPLSLVVRLMAFWIPTVSNLGDLNN